MRTRSCNDTRIDLWFAGDDVLAIACIPGPEQRLVADEVPGLQQVAAVPVGLDRRRVPRAHLREQGRLGEHRIDDDQPSHECGREPRKFQRDGATEPEAADLDRAVAQHVERLSQHFGVAQRTDLVVGDDAVRVAVTRQVGHQHATRCRDLECQRRERRGRTVRLVQQQHRRPVAETTAPHAQLAAGHVHELAVQPSWQWF